VSLDYILSHQPAMAYVEDSNVKLKYDGTNETTQVVSEVEAGVAEKIKRTSSIFMVIVAGAALFSDGCEFGPRTAQELAAQGCAILTFASR
jgi:hypothetical protein